MSVPWTQVEPLALDHELEDFRPGRDSVDVWLKEKARQSTYSVATSVCLGDARASSRSSR